MPEKNVVYGDSDWAGSHTEHNRNSRTAWTASHRIQLLNSARRHSLMRRGRAAAAGELQSVQPLAEAGMDLKQEVLTDSTANLGMHNRIGSGRVRHLDVKWLWTQKPCKLGDSH